MIRSTTTGTLKSYRYNLQRSTYTQNKARNTVLTQRNFNSFAEDPAAAAKAFQLRRSYSRANSQASVNQSVVSKYDQAWSSLESVVQDVDNRKSDSAFAALLRGESDATASGRNALGQSLTQLASGIVQTMNGRYGDNFIFAGVDGLEVPFTWEGEGDTRQLVYRGINVSGSTTEDLAVLDYMVNDETKYADLGFGLQENEQGKIIDSSAANVALQGITFLGYGTDEDGDPKNIVSIIDRMGVILKNCDADSGNWASPTEKEEFYRLATKFEDASDQLQNKHVELDTQAAFYKSNQAQLENQAYTTMEQFLGIEDADLAEAITAFSWAQYCYNAALKVGNSILSENLMDYLQF